MKAIWNNQTLAESNNTVVVEGNHYFPPDSLKKEYFEPSDHRTTCPFKGVAFYYTLNVDGEKNNDSAWYYPNAKDEFKEIEGYVAFWRGVEVSE